MDVKPGAKPEGREELERQIRTVLRIWLVEKIYGSPIARSTEGFNYLVENLPDLNERLAAALYKKEV